MRVSNNSDIPHSLFRQVRLLVLPAVHTIYLALILPSWQTEKKYAMVSQ
jgi:hypothetical protein